MTERPVADVSKLLVLDVSDNDDAPKWKWRKGLDERVER